MNAQERELCNEEREPRKTTAWELYQMKKKDKNKKATDDGLKVFETLFVRKTIPTIDKINQK
jgi:hypothetical protein